jgi:hypothetical protein
MLNILSNVETAAGARAGFGLGAFLPGYVGTVQPSGTGVMVRPRPRVDWTPDAFGVGCTATRQGTAAGLGQPLGLQNPCEKYAHTTRIAAASGGALGPHPARDPV